MNYFQTLGLVFGVFSLTAGIALALRPKNFSGGILLRAFPEKRPVWLTVFTLIWLVLCLYSWVFFTQILSAYSFLITLVLTLGLIKAFFMHTQYVHFRKILESLLTTEKVAVLIFSFSAVAVGAGLMVVTLRM